ncbi:MAG: hypothetical protein AAGE84_23300 [Cyanobacteria bacterium P01_G01_bin.39]
MKLLCIISNDFGELSDACYFTKGYNFDVSLLLPPRLFAVNQGKLPSKAYLYKTVRDILDIVDRQQPELIFLFSGYLYAINKILSLEAVRDLLENLKQRHCQVATSDPFLGILADLNDATFGKDFPFQQPFLQHFSKVFTLLQKLPHLYTTPVASTQKVRQFAFFNPNIEIPPHELSTYAAQLARVLPVNLDQKRWLFILSSEDYVTQINLHGQAKFHASLKNKLEETVESGCQPIILTSKRCIEAVRNLKSQAEGAIYLSFCPYAIFTKILLEAEYLFLWNVFSNCLLSRLGNHKPVFFFHPGHLSQAIPSLHKLGMKYSYSEANLSYLDLFQPLQSSELAEQVPVQEQAFVRSQRRFRESPTPDQVVRQLLSP